MRMLVVRGDHNDADWITQVTPITQKQLDRYTPLIKAIKGFKSYKAEGTTFSMVFTHDHNWPVGDYGHRDDLGEKSIVELYGKLAQEFDEEYVPHADGNIHTIYEIFTVQLDKRLFKKS
jgi:hypothetical protein